MNDSRTIKQVIREHCDQSVWRWHRSTDRIYRWVVAFLSLSLCLCLSFFYVHSIWVIKLFSSSASTSRLIVVINVCSKSRKWHERTTLKHVTCLILVALVWQVYVYYVKSYMMYVFNHAHLQKKSNKIQITKAGTHVRNHYVWWV
jgi:hypothetical protein